MADSRFNKVCNVLTNYNFDINEDVSDDFVCKICKKIMIDPYSGICGCQYCYLCIKDYIGEDLKHCPGGTEECAEEFLVMEKNVHKNLTTRRNIFHMMIKCPHASCFFRSRLEKIDEHIRICAMTPVDCSFKTIGCINEGLLEDNVKAHLDLDAFKHSQMIVEAINHLKNDVNGLKHILEDKGIEINELREETENNKREIENVKEDSRRKEILMREEIRILKENQERIESQSEVMKEEEKKMIKEIEEIKQEINMLKSSGERTEYENKERRDGEMIIKKELEMIKTDIVKMKETTKKNEEEIKVVMMTKEVWLNINEDFVWKIKDFNNKINNNEREYFSDSFYKDDYTLCLRAQIGHDKFDRWLCFYVIIMRGERDERVKWPMKHTITINIINQDSLKIHTCWTVNYDKYKDKSLFDKPQSNNNEYIYCGGILYSDIKDIRGIIIDDSIVLGCLISSK